MKTTASSLKTQASAEALALTALAWLAADEDRIMLFLAQSGILSADLGARAAEPEVLAAVLDHLLGDEAQLLHFAHEAGFSPEALVRARAALPGGDVPHWT